MPNDVVRQCLGQGLRLFLRIVHLHNGNWAVAVPADMDGAFPESFYSTTNQRTQVRLKGEWIEVEDQEMDCGILLDVEGKSARCLPMTQVRKGDVIVVGRQGLRVLPAETAARSDGGIARAMCSRRGVADTTRNSTPDQKTIPSAVCHGTLACWTIVNAKKALRPMPGATANGRRA